MFVFAPLTKLQALKTYIHGPPFYADCKYITKERHSFKNMERLSEIIIKKDSLIRLFIKDNAIRRKVHNYLSARVPNGYVAMQLFLFLKNSDTVKSVG